MSNMSASQTKNKNRTAIVLCVIALIAAVILLSLPVFSFSAKVYTKKSSNTDVGSDKYYEVLAQVEEVAAGYGSSARITESLTQRTNSKGETSTLVTFQIVADTACSGWRMMGSGLPAGTMLLILLILSAAACTLAVIAWRLSPDTLPARLSNGQRVMRVLVCAFAVCALLLIPLTAMNMNRVLNREIGLAIQDEQTEAVQPMMTALDQTLFDGEAGEKIADYLSGMQFKPTVWFWLLLPALFVLLIGGFLLKDWAVGKGLSRLMLYLFIIAVCIIVLYPYYVMFISAFRSPAETNDMEFRNLLPTKWIWSNLSDIVDRGVLTFLGNSLMLSTGATVIALVCGIPAAYAMARMKFKGKKAFLGFVIMSQMFSPVVLLVGISKLMNTLQLNDTIPGLMLINAAFNQAFAIWLLRGTFVSISSEMEQAACIDGCTVFGALVRILLPMAAPGIVTTLIFVFINSWNEYTISTVLISTPALKPITVGITQFSSFNMIEWQYLFAAALVATIPVVILFMCIEKHLAAGLTAGGVKG